MGKTDTKTAGAFIDGVFLPADGVRKGVLSGIVTGELQWVVDELMSDESDADLLQAIGEELREGAYQNESGGISVYNPAGKPDDRLRI